MGMGIGSRAASLPQTLQVRELKGGCIMQSNAVIDIYNGEAYDPQKHLAKEVFWSDGRFCYWGWLYDSSGREVGDFTAPSVQDAEKALGVKFHRN